MLNIDMQGIVNYSTCKYSSLGEILMDPDSEEGEALPRIGLDMTNYLFLTCHS